MASEQLSTDDIITEEAHEGFSAKRTAEIVNITYRQLDYWARTDLVKPTSPAAGSGSRRTYSYKNLLELDQDPTEVNLVIQGDAVMIQSGEQIIDLLRNGQGVLNVLPLAGVQSEVDARIVELFPEFDIESFKAPAAIAQ